MSWREILECETDTQNSHNTQKVGKRGGFECIEHISLEARFRNNNNNNLHTKKSISLEFDTQNTQNIGVDSTQNPVADNEDELSLSDVQAIYATFSKMNHKVSVCRGCSNYSVKLEDGITRPWCRQIDMAVFELERCPKGRWWKCKGDDIDGGDPVMGLFDEEGLDNKDIKDIKDNKDTKDIS